MALHAVSIATKGRLGVATSTATNGIIPVVDITNPVRNFCDYPHATKIATKGNLSDAVGTGVKGKLPKICDAVPPTPTFCDYPIGVKLATMGRLGATVGTATRGRVLRICISEVPIKSGPAMRGFRKEESRKKKIIVTVYAYGKECTTEKIVDYNQTVKVSDLEIIDIGNKEIKIIIKGVSKK